MSNTTLIKLDNISVALAEDNPDLLDTRRWRKLDSDAAIELLGLLHSIPAAATALSMSQYKVCFPKGIPANSHLLRKANGHFQPTLADENGQFVANAEILDASIQKIAYSVFQVLSIVTQQYYLHEINQQMTDLREKLDQVLDFLYTDKACELYAEAQAIQAIYQNYASIMNHPEQRIIALQTIQHAKILAERNTQFYIRDIGRLSNSVVKEVKSVRDDLNSYTQTLSLYGICSALEILLSQNFDESYLAYIEKDLKTHYDQHNMNISKLKGCVEVAAKALKNEKPAILGIQIGGAPDTAPIDALHAEITEILGDRSPVRGFEDTVRKIQTSFSTPTEYRITENGEVFQKV